MIVHIVLRKLVCLKVFNHGTPIIGRYCGVRICTRRIYIIPIPDITILFKLRFVCFLNTSHYFIGSIAFYSAETFWRKGVKIQDIVYMIPVWMCYGYMIKLTYPVMVP